MEHEEKSEIQYINIFLCWSGDVSHQVAKILYQWLPNVMQVVKPWISSEDIDSGARWPTEIAKKLEIIKIGMICLTKENQKETCSHIHLLMRYGFR